MPQLDKFIFVSQYFWLFFLLFITYFLLVKFVLPFILRALKVRKLKLLRLGGANEQLLALIMPKSELFHQNLMRFNSFFVGYYDNFFTRLQGNEKVRGIFFKALFSNRFELPLVFLANKTVYGNFRGWASLASEKVNLYPYFFYSSFLNYSNLPSFRSNSATFFLFARWGIFCWIG